MGLPPVRQPPECQRLSTDLAPLIRYLTPTVLLLSVLAPWLSMLATKTVSWDARGFFAMAITSIAVLALCAHLFRMKSVYLLRDYVLVVGACGPTRTHTSVVCDALAGALHFRRCGSSSNPRRVSRPKPSIL